MPQIHYSTAEWLVVSKPSGWLTIPGRGGHGFREKPDLTSEMSFERPVLSQWLEKQAPPIWTVHRLDYETSGLVLFARSAAAHRKANQWFQNREVKKTYLCLASGIPVVPIFKIAQPIAGAPSTTQIEVKEFFPQARCFFAQAVPVTGRRHQIRIHLASKGFPILGDVKYGGPKSIQTALEITRVALHAFSLRLPSGENFEIPLAMDMASWLNAFTRKSETGESDESKNSK